MADHEPFISNDSDPDNAAGYFAAAREAEANADTVQARTAYRDAKDRDELRFRAPEAFNSTIREAAEAYGATVVDVQAAMDDASPRGVVGSNLMTEHLHPNSDGYIVMADAFYRALRDAGMFGAWPDEVESDATIETAVFSEIDSLLGDYRIKVLKNAWPFQPPGTTGLPEFEAKTESETISRQVYRGDITRPEGLEKLRVLRASQGNIAAAIDVSESLLLSYWFLADPHLAMGDILVSSGRSDEALRHYMTANELSESNVAQRMIGSILLESGRRAEAVEHLERAVQLNRDDTQALYNLSGAYALEKRYEEARQTLARLLELDPGHVGGQRLLGSIP